VTFIAAGSFFRSSWYGNQLNVGSAANPCRRVRQSDWDARRPMPSAPDHRASGDNTGAARWSESRTFRTSSARRLRAEARGGRLDAPYPRRVMP